MFQKVFSLDVMLVVGIVSLVWSCDGGEESAGLSVTEVSTETVAPAGVRVAFSVRNEGGAPVNGLSLDDVEILADDRPLSAEGIAEPVLVESPNAAHSTLLLIDLSNGAIDGEMLDAELDAAVELADYLAPDQRIAVYVYAGSTRFDRVVDFTADMDEVLALIGPSGSLRGHEGLGSRDLYRSISWALDDLEALSLPLASSKTLVVFAAGGDQAMAETSINTQARIQVAADRDIRVFTLGVGPNVDLDELEAFGIHGAEWSTDPEDLPAAALRTAFLISEMSGGIYLLGLCSPRVGGERTLTLNIHSGAESGSLIVTYDADGFDMAGCDPEAIIRD
jgi:hypothetical protein